MTLPSFVYVDRRAKRGHSWSTPTVSESDTSHRAAIASVRASVLLFDASGSALETSVPLRRASIGPMKVPEALEVAGAVGGLLGVVDVLVAAAFFAFRARGGWRYAAAIAALAVAAGVVLVASANEGPICHEQGCFASTAYVTKAWLFVAIVGLLTFGLVLALRRVSRKADHPLA